MPTLADLKKKLQEMQQKVPAIMLEAATSVSLAGKALAERTIRDKGFGEQYSKEKIPVWFLKGKELNAAGKQYIESREELPKKKRKLKTIEQITEKDLADGMGSWGDFRKAQGLQTSFVDLGYSNEMWRGMFPREAFQQGSRYIAPLAHNNKAGQDKMNWNRDRYGDFIGKVLTGDNFTAMGNVAVDEVYRLLLENSDL